MERVIPMSEPCLSKSQKMLLTDSLTGLANWRLFKHHLSNEFNKIHRYNQYLSILIINIDSIMVSSNISSDADHDAVLKFLANRWNKCIGFSGDMLARYSGNKFGVILLHANELHARGIAQKFTTIAHYHNVSTKIGIAFSHEATTVENLIDIANHRLYQARVSETLIDTLEF